jgi:hypothetical protein
VIVKVQAIKLRNKKVVLDIGERVEIKNIRNMGQNQDLAKVVEIKR